MWKATALVLTLRNLDVNMIMWMSLFLQPFKLSQVFQGQPSLFREVHTQTGQCDISASFHSKALRFRLVLLVFSNTIWPFFFFHRFYLQRKSCKCGVIVPRSSICLGLQPAWQSACSQQLFVLKQEADCCSGGKGLFHLPQCWNCWPELALDRIRELSGEPCAPVCLSKTGREKRGIHQKVQLPAPVHE